MTQKYYKYFCTKCRRLKMKNVFLKFDEKLCAFSMSGSDASGQNPDCKHQGLTSDESDTTIGIVRPAKYLRIKCFRHKLFVPYDFK